MESIIIFGVISLLIVVAPYLSSLTKLPLVVVEILLGSIASCVGFFHHSLSLELIAHIGFLFLMFLCGLEVDLKALRQLGFKFLGSASLYLFLMYGLAAIYVFYRNLSEFYIVALPVMSLGMIMALLKEYPKNTWLQLALNVGILGELLSIITLVILNGAYSYGLTWNLYQTLFVLFAFLVVIIWAFKITDILFWWFPTLKFFVIPKDSNKNQDIRFSAMLFLSMIGIVQILELEVVLGAFLAGMILSTYFRYHKDLLEKLHDFGFGFFIPLFFVYVGSTLDINLIIRNPDLLSQTFLIVVVMVSLRVIAALIVYRNYFCSYQKTILFAFSHSMPLTFLVATAQLGRQFHAITIEEYYSFILAALLESIFLTICIKFIDNFKGRALL